MLDPFHVVRLAAQALDRCRQRTQQATLGRRGLTRDPLYPCRRALLTGPDLLTGRQRVRLRAVFTVDEHLPVEATWMIYQHLVAGYRDPDRQRRR